MTREQISKTRETAQQLEKIADGMGSLQGFYAEIAVRDAASRLWVMAKHYEQQLKTSKP